MNYFSVDKEILTSVQPLNGSQKTDLLDYIKNIRPITHSKRLYRRRAMKQIREALLDS